MKVDDFDETILDSEEEFNKRFKRIERPAFLGKPKPFKDSKSRITIYLDADIVEHFKMQAENSKTGYQTFDKPNSARKIDGSQNVNQADELVERLLQDKTALSRLKAELETIG